MHILYDIWKAYATFVVETFSEYCSRTGHWPFVLSFAPPLLLAAATGLLLPKWLSMPFYAAFFLPYFWFLGGMVRCFYIAEIERKAFFSHR